MSARCTARWKHEYLFSTNKWVVNTLKLFQTFFKVKITTFHEKYAYQITHNACFTNNALFNEFSNARMPAHSLLHDLGNCFDHDVKKLPRNAVTWLVFLRNCLPPLFFLYYNTYIIPYTMNIIYRFV